MNLQTNYKDSLQNHVIIKMEESTDSTKIESVEASLEKVAEWISHNHCEKIDIAKDDDNTSIDPDKLKKYLNFLEAKIAAARKTATFWDAYNITTCATDEEDFIQKYAKLATNSALIIGSNNAIHIGNNTYKRGDIVVKNRDNQQILIKNTETGYYKPTTLTKSEEGSNTFELTFSYQDGSNGSPVDLILDMPTTDDGVLYNDIITISTGSSYLLTLKNNIKPTYYVYEQLDENQLGQRLFESVKVTYSDTTAQFDNLTDRTIMLVVR